MSKGPRISPTVKQTIYEMALENRNRPRRAVVARLKEVIEHMGEPVPSDETLERLVSRARASELSQLDTSWSLGASVAHNIPSEANADLLQIWKWCVVVGRTFTIREALWVSRLRGIVPFEELLMWAAEYALAEQAVASMHESSVDTTPLDFDLAFKGSEEGFSGKIGTWVKFAVHRGGTVPWPSPGYFKYKDLGGESHKRGILTCVGIKPSMAVERLHGLKPMHRSELPEDTDMVYTIWLSLFSRSSKWKDMSNEAKEVIAQRLHEEVYMAREEIAESWQRVSESMAVHDLWNLFVKVVSWEPSLELINEVGVKRAHYRPESYERRMSGLFKKAKSKED